MGKILKGLATWVVALIVIIVIVVAAVGIYYGITLTHRPTVTTTTTTTTSTTTITTTTSTIPITNISITTLTAPGMTATTGKTTIVFYTWWALTGKYALEAVLQQFYKQYPQYVIATEILPGGGGVNAFPAIISLIKAGKPPDLFQMHMGPQMFSLIEEFPGGPEAGLKDVVNWTSFYNKYLAGHVIPEIYEAGALAGDILSIGTQVHTGSILYINIKVLKHYGLPVPTNISQLIYDTQQLVKDGFYNSTCAPWGIAGAEGGWDGMQLWESIFLALAGPKLYNEFTYGTLNLSDPHVLQIINETNTIFAELAQYRLPGWESLTWQQMAEELATGHVAFFVMGDWATNAMYDTLGVLNYPATPEYINNPNVTVVVEAFPGTENYVAIVVDSIGMPSESILGPTAYQAAYTFLSYLSSYQGETTWAKWKGESYYLNVSPSIYNSPEQAWAYERLVNLSNYPSNWVYYWSDGGLFLTPLDIMETAILNFEEGIYHSADLIHAINESVTVERETWLTAASFGLGYLGFPGHPFGNYTPPWVNSSSSDPQKVVNSMYKNDNGANAKSSMSPSIFMLPNLAILATLALTPTIAVSKRKIFNL